MNKAIKDLYNADFSDLHKLGINYCNQFVKIIKSLNLKTNLLIF